MIFAKIDFINLLPFYIFIKKNIRSSQIKQIINYKKSYPSIINKQFKNRKIDAAFISSIASRNCNCLDIGIVAQNEVLSVLALKGEYEKDFQSESSNALAKILNIKGKILIGDKALYHYENSKSEEFIDLAKVWKEKYNLPFVFARLCVNKNDKYLKDLTTKFLKTKVKIPQYIIKQYSKKTGVSVKLINRYLAKISYKISKKEKHSLKLFLKLTKQQGH
ncbi:MAG: MqnA/MqnD/SBP family protein [Campylobacterota bacterium]|nr:MqnA/MqnD/SBP family protein [Campylobacterota bacterium]